MNYNVSCQSERVFRMVSGRFTAGQDSSALDYNAARSQETQTHNDRDLLLDTGVWQLLQYLQLIMDYWFGSNQLQISEKNHLKYSATPWITLTFSALNANKLLTHLCNLSALHVCSQTTCVSCPYFHSLRMVECAYIILRASLIMPSCTLCYEAA